MSDKSDPLHYRGIAFEGGGVAGVGHVGVIKKSTQINLYDKLTHFAGSSAGAIIAGLAACRIPSDKIEQIMYEMDLKKFEDSSWFVPVDMYRIFHDFGWNEGSAIKEIYSSILEKYIGDGHITFEQVKRRFDTILVITATDFGAQKTIYYTPDTSPDLEIAEAVRRSASFPLVFCPIRDFGKLLIDGGTLDNYPIRALYTYLPEDQVIGSKLVGSTDWSRTKSLPTNIIDYVKMLIEMLHNQNLRVHVKDSDWKRTIKVDIGQTSVLDFGLSEDQKRDLVKAGEQAAEIFFGVR